jgi:hypothetical protein
MAFQPMAINPLAPVTDYQSTLNRIFWFTSAAALWAVWMLRTEVPSIDALLERLDQTAAGKFLPIEAGYLLPALAVGLVSRIFRIHSQLGHWLGVRERFDVDVILKELGRQVDMDIDAVSEDQWLAHRHELMRKCFYQYASSRSPQIDEHLIHQALDLWSWFWIVLEASVLFVVTGLALVCANVLETGIITFGSAILIAAVGLPAIRLQCKRYAIAQVRAILADPAREAVIRQTLAVLDDRPASWRRAA